jgi:predicted AAA+ superfamily ATPase
VEKELFRFLSSPIPEVLCINGPWGVGKTYLWKKCLIEASGKGDGLALGRCAYVSLFGVNSLDELKYSIFENTIKSDQVAAGASLDTLKAVAENTEGLGRRQLGY